MVQTNLRSELEEQRWYGRTRKCNTELRELLPNTGCTRALWWPVGWGSGVRREAPEGRDICALTADSHRRTTESSTTLESGYPPIKKKFKMVVCTYSGILFIKRKETGSFVGMRTDLCCYTEWINQKKNIVHEHIYVESRKDFNLFAGQEQICQGTDRWHRREGEVWRVETQTLTHITSKCKVES